MKLNKIITPKFILYIFLLIAMITHFSIQGINNENLTDFIISILIMIILSFYFINLFIEKG